METLINSNYNLVGSSAPCATSEQVEQLALENLNTTISTGADNRSTTERFGFENLNSTREFGLRAADTAQGFGISGMNTTEKFGLYNSDKTEFYGLKNFEAAKDALKDVLLQNCQNTDAIIQSQTAGFAAVALQNSEIAAASQLAMCNNTAAIQLAAVVNAKDAAITATINAKDAALTAAINAAAIAKQVAECCCEQRELTRSEGEATRSLINATTTQNLRDKLDAARDELVALRLRASLTPALTPSVTI